MWQHKLKKKLTSYFKTSDRPPDLNTDQPHHTDLTPTQTACAESRQATQLRLGSCQLGLKDQEVLQRQANIGKNQLPQAAPLSIFSLFVHQFTSPLVYVLLAAAIVSLLIGDLSDAIFIAIVLVINALIGLLQEYSAQKSAQALTQLVTTQAHVIRDGETYEIDAIELVPGDRIILSSGERVPADIRLIDTHDLEIDESLLTGESETVRKQSDVVLTQDTPLADRSNCAFAGTLISRGRGHGVVIATAMQTELGQIADSVLSTRVSKAPLQIRMEKFNSKITWIMGLVILIMAALSFGRGLSISEIFLSSVALAVAAIPEGLPVAMTVALAIGMRRMAKRNVIVRKLMAVEALGSCTCIASDKTGTLTVNQLTVRALQCPGSAIWPVTGSSHEPEGEIQIENAADAQRLKKLCEAAVLANEGILARRDGHWITQGDAVDVALLIMAQKTGITREETLAHYPELSALPYESSAQFSASANRVGQTVQIVVKGASEKILSMCSSMLDEHEHSVPMDIEHLTQQVDQLTSQGFRVLALAEGSKPHNQNLEKTLKISDCHDLCFLGLIGIIDPLRKESRAAIAACREAGIHVAMITGDHPGTALAIARDLGLCQDEHCLITGPELKLLQNNNKQDQLIAEASVFARVEPQQKLDIVRALQRQGHFVAVSGDGANDAPALRAAEVGVAMGKSGTDVARETADIIITNDQFDSIVSGIEEGRHAYSNVRKVIFLLISTGCAELVLFAFSLISGLPLPLLPVQLLWLNLVSNGIQDVALAFEPIEGDELKQPPRSPNESIFNRLMITRVLISALVMGSVAYLLFSHLIDTGMSVESARNSTLLLMVLFENVHVFNSRSERFSVFQQSLLRNRLLLFGTLIAQALHIMAMYIPGLSDVLGVHPVTFEHWLNLLGMALTVMLAIELHKYWWNKSHASTS